MKGAIDSLESVGFYVGASLKEQALKMAGEVSGGGDR